MLAALLAFWPRERGRGHLFLSLATLLVMVASPVVSIGGSNQVLLGAVLAALTVCFLWLERLPRRSWIGIAVLGVVVAAPCRSPSAADGDSPWFDYRAWAEEFGPGTPVAFDWGHSYGPLDWPREGSEVLRVDARRPSYWKVENLDEFDGAVWRTSGISSLREEAEDELAEDYLQRPQWTEELRVTVRRLEGAEVVTAGTALRVEESGRPVREGEAPGSFRRLRRLHERRLLHGHRARPEAVADQLAEAATGREGRHVEEELQIAVPLRREAATERADPADGRGSGGERGDRPLPGLRHDRRGAEGRRAVPRGAAAPGRAGARCGSRTTAETWRLARQLRAEATTPYEYVLAIDRYLQDGFTYSESPAAIPPERTVLDAFLTETKSGYCQHFSGAMALLLRMGGVPARVVTGFAPGGHSDRKDAWIVRDTDAHSWVEAWFDEFGWVTFDPTPPATPARSQIAALTAAPEESGPSGDAAERQRRAHRRRAPRPARPQSGPGGAGAGAGADGRRDLRLVARAAAAARRGRRRRGGWPAGAGAAGRSVAASSGSSPSWRRRSGASGGPRRRA